jgi:hypothetical protein
LKGVSEDEEEKKRVARVAFACRQKLATRQGTMLPLLETLLSPETWKNMIGQEQTATTIPKTFGGKTTAKAVGSKFRKTLDKTRCSSFYCCSATSRAIVAGRNRTTITVRGEGVSTLCDCTLDTPNPAASSIPRTIPAANAATLSVSNPFGSDTN